MKKGEMMRKEYNFENGKRGAVAKQSGKTRITIFLDDDIISVFRKKAEMKGTGYQSEINSALRSYLDENNHPVTKQELYEVLRELKTA
jgi:uncharacterized protein (DUF4415 family)